jgi:ABC-type Fe3+ transport system permease subunit
MRYAVLRWHREIGDERAVKQPSEKSSVIEETTPSPRFDFVGWALAIPLLVFLGFTFFYPLIYTFILSFQKKSGTGVTIQNYLQFLATSDGQKILSLTIFLSIMATLVSVLLSLPLSMVLRKRFFGKSVVQFLMLVPALIPSLVGALGLLILYDQTGWINYFLVRVLHISSSPIAIDYTIPGIILFYVWMFFPYGGLVILSGLQAIDPAVEEAGRVLGASPIRVFWRIVLPLLKPSLMAGSILIFLQAFGAFSIPLIAGGNYQPLAVKIFTVATVFLEWPRASAMAVVMGVIQIVLVLLFRKIQAKQGAPS